MTPGQIQRGQVTIAQHLPALDDQIAPGCRAGQQQRPAPASRRRDPADIPDGGIGRFAQRDPATDRAAQHIGPGQVPSGLIQGQHDVRGFD